MNFRTNHLTSSSVTSRTLTVSCKASVYCHNNNLFFSDNRNSIRWAFWVLHRPPSTRQCVSCLLSLSNQRVSIASKPWTGGTGTRKMAYRRLKKRYQDPRQLHRPQWWVSIITFRACAHVRRASGSKQVSDSPNQTDAWGQTCYSYRPVAHSPRTVAVWIKNNWNSTRKLSSRLAQARPVPSALHLKWITH